MEQQQISKREDYFKNENFQLTERTESMLIGNRKKYVSNLLNQKPKIYILKKKKNLQIIIDNLDLPDNYKTFEIKNIVNKSFILLFILQAKGPNIINLFNKFKLLL